MSCAIDQELLPRYLDGELPDAMREQVEHELTRCDECCERLAELTFVGAAVRMDIGAAVEAAPLDGLWDRIEQGLAPVEPSSTTLWSRLRAWWSERPLEIGLSLAAASAALLVCVWMAAQMSAGEPALVQGVAFEQTAGALGAEVNTLIVESCEVRQGTVIFDVDPDDPGAPAVVWHYVDDEQEAI